MYFSYPPKFSIVDRSICFRKMKNRTLLPNRVRYVLAFTIGLDFFPSCIIRTAGPKKVENTSTLYHPGCGLQVQSGTENWYRTPIRRFNFLPVRSHAYFPEWKSALKLTGKYQGEQLAAAHV